MGVDASGNVEGCTAVGGGGAYSTTTSSGSGEVTATCTSGNAVMGGCISPKPRECMVSQTYPSIGWPVIMCKQSSFVQAFLKLSDPDHLTTGQPQLCL